MDPDGPVTVVKRRRLGKWLRRLAAFFLLAPPLGFGLSNACLGSKWGREAIASRISRRCGLETRIAGASWSPWNGISLRGLEIAQPEQLGGLAKEPLLALETVRITPVWRGLLRGRPVIREVDVKRPRVVLTVEMLSHLAGRMQPTAGPQVAVAEPPATGPATPPEAPPPHEGVPNTPAQPPTQSPVPQPVATGPTAWLRVESAEIRVIGAAGGRVWLETAGVDAAVPLGGAAADGHVSIGSLDLAGNRVLSETKVPLQWQAPFLTMEQRALRVAGVNGICVARLALLPGLPVQIAAEVPPQALPAVTGPGGMSGEAREVFLRAGFSGVLTAPRTWQGELAAAAAGVTVRDSGQTVAFDTAAGTALLRGGMLAVPDARMLGEDLSLLGNGMVLGDGGLSAVLRITAPPETAVALVRRMFPDLKEDPKPVPLSSPQRAALDLTLSGSVREPLLRIGAPDPDQPSETPPPPP
ncbi:MAG: hypothetical protein J0M04_07675 [Verrucomicrobia bacterium]|nr:hypothetical protein [Verrucomicrobiota bacterium]